MNDTSKVSAGKPKIGGAIYRAPVGTTLPTSASAELDTAYKCLGYISDDGLTNSTARTSETVKAWGGDTVMTNQTEFEDTLGFTLIEVLNVDVLKTVYGDANVTGDLDTGIVLRVRSDELPFSVFVIDMILQNCLKRIVVPFSKVTEVGEVNYNDSDPVGYETTVTALPYGEWDGDTHREYIVKKAAQTA